MTNDVNTFAFGLENLISQLMLLPCKTLFPQIHFDPSQCLSFDSSTLVGHNPKCLKGKEKTFL